jgi:hypothetical protein
LRRKLSTRKHVIVKDILHPSQFQPLIKGDFVLEWLSR